jgi:mycothiol synthase
MSSSPPERITVRASGPEDAAALAGVANALSEKLYGVTDVSEDFVRSWFKLPNLTFWLAELDGRVVGHLDIEHERDENRFKADARVHPEAWDTGAEEALLETAEAWARERAEPGAVMHAYANEREVQHREALEQRGFRPVRHFFRMQIDFDGPIEEPASPEGVVIREYDPAHDEERAYEAHQESFEEHWGSSRSSLEEWRMYMLADGHDPSLWKIAEADGEIAGVSINAWHQNGDRTFGWVRVLGVRKPWRRHGVGLALLRSSFAEFQSRGATRAGLGVDAQNETGAVGLYERAGMHVVRREDTFEKLL